MFNLKKFGANMARLRKLQDMTQSELAEKLNLTRQAVSKYEVGDSFPDISILDLIAGIFRITINDLINAGEPTLGEALILEGMVKDTDKNTKLEVKDFVNLPPLLKPSVLDKLVQSLGDQGIDISNIVTIAEFLTDSSILRLLKTASYDSLSEELIEKFIPFLDEKAKSVLIEKIIDGKHDWHMLKIMLPFLQFMNVALIEAAVIDGALPKDVLIMMHNYKFGIKQNVEG